MLPSGRDNTSRTSYSEQQQRPISDKEEIARAALRSLASPSGTSTPNEPQLLPPPPPPPLATPSYSASSSSTTQLPPPPHPSQYAPPRELPRRSKDDEYRRDERAARYDRRDPAGLIETGLTRDSSSSSFFQEQAITASPESSPILAAAPSLPPPPPSQMHSRRSIPSTSSSSDIHEFAIRHASIALGVNAEEVRHIVHNAYASRRTSSNSSSAASAAASSQSYLPQEPESPFVRQVLDTYSLESDRAAHHPSQSQAHAHSHSDYDYDGRRSDSARVSSSSFVDSRATAAAAEPSGMPRHDPGSSSYRAPPRPTQYSLTDRAPPQVGWGSTANNFSTSQDLRHLHHGTFRSAYPAYQDTRRNESSTSAALASTSNAPVVEQRDESPSPFAYDAYRSTSQPVPPPQEAGYGSAGASSGRMPTTRASQDYLDELARSRAIEEERRAGLRPRYPVSSYAQQHSYAPPSSLYDRKVRSIDDYLEQQQQQQQQQQLPRRRRGSIAYYPGRSTATVAEYEDDRLPDRHTRSINRHSFQPYPAPASRYATGPSSAAAAASSPQLSPTMPEPPRFQHLSQQQFSQLRSPAPRSPAAETVASVASSSVASAAGMTPSPLLGAVGPSSAKLVPEDRERGAKPSPGVSSDRSVSVDTAAESTRAGVAKMQIDDDGSSSKAPRAASRKPGSSRSSFSHADRGSAPIAGTDLSHSEIMQRLQDKVKSRLAAKGKAASTTGKSGKNGKNTSTSSSGNRIARLARGNSNKRSASSITKSDSPSRVPGASPSPSGSRAVQSKSSSSSNNNLEAPTAEKSASPMGGVPATKVRRTSASSQQKPAKPSPKSPPSKPSSPVSTAKSTATPTSIEAALLSPTDTPTPSEAAATHAQRMSRSPLPPAEGIVESSSGQALPGEIPGAGQMNAASATKQQTSKSGIDSLIQAAQANDPTETNSAIA